MSLNPEQEWAWIAELEKMGLVQAKYRLDRKEISPAYVFLTSTWVSEQEQEEKRREEARQSEQMELKRRDSAAIERQATAAEQANTRASIAIWIAGISLIVSIAFSILTLLKH
jgi:hypothetical protein